MKKYVLLILLLIGSISGLIAMEEESIQIFVKTLEGEKVAIPINKNTTIAYLKAVIERDKGIPVKDQKVIFSGKIFADPESLLINDLKIAEGSTLYITHPIEQQYPPDETWHIFVKTILGKNISIEINQNMTVADLKTKIKEKEGIPVEDQRIISQGKFLDDTKLLIKDLKVQNVNFLHLVLPVPKQQPANQNPSPAQKIARFTLHQKVAIVLATGALVTTIAGIMKIHSYKNKKERLVKKYNLGKLSSLQNKVWSATIVASYGIPWYLRSIVEHSNSSLTALIGNDPCAIAELYYGHMPTSDELDAFLAKFFQEQSK